MKVTRMIELLKKVFIFTCVVAVCLLFYFRISWNERRSKRPSMPYQTKEHHIKPSKFRVFLEDNLIIDEDFTDRPANTVFKQLRGNETVDIDEDDIGSIKPVNLIHTTHKDLKLRNIFRPTISDTDKILFMYVFQKFIDVCNQNNISFFLYDGSLIGSYRHHGFVPWDDDLDVFVNSSQKDLLAREGSKLPGFVVFQPERFQWKFYHQNLSTRISGSRFRWPYIDIFFWKTSPTELFDYTYERKYHTWKYSVVFPLKLRPFEGALLRCPRQTHSFLKKKYNVQDCQINTYSHRYERPTRWSKKVNCEILEGFYPFVKHSIRTSCNETLFHRGKIIDTFAQDDC